MAEAQKIFKNHVKEKNVKQHIALLFRIYQYFHNNSDLINCQELDQLFFLGNIGKISHQTSDNLCQCIEEFLEFIHNLPMDSSINTDA